MDQNSNNDNSKADSDKKAPEKLYNHLQNCSIRYPSLFKLSLKLLLLRCDAQLKELDIDAMALLHRAIISNGAVIIAQKLIESGGNINGCDVQNWTPLHYAVSDQRLEWVCMLLSYGVNVRIKSTKGVTPLLIAFKKKRGEIMKHLLSHYYEFANINLTNIVIDYKSKINNDEDLLLLTLAMNNGYSEPFKLIWPRINVIPLTNVRICDDLLIKYSYDSNFMPCEWFDCLFVILESPNTRDLLEKINFFQTVLYNLTITISIKKFDADRLREFLYMFLSTGMKIQYSNIYHIYNIFGFKEELEAIIFAGNCNFAQRIDNYSFLHFILNFKVDFTTENVYEYLYKQVKITVNPSDVLLWFKYFSFPAHFKTKLISATYSSFCSYELNKKCWIPLYEIQEIPSLVELCRLEVQKSIMHSNKINKPYQMHDAVKKLSLPTILKDILLFKRPIYM